MKQVLFINLVLISYLLSSCATFMKPPAGPAIPSRPLDAYSGSQFIEKIRNINEFKREMLILAEFRRGNIPEHLRTFIPISIKKRLNNGRTINGRIWVSSDYLAIGSEQDFVRLPMNPITAQRIADHFGCILPTAKMVDLIYSQANVKLKPKPFPPGPNMVRTAQYVRHNEVIEDQIASRDLRQLIAGHKKDVVISNKLLRKKKKVAIYGWHQMNGKAIQPLSTVHGNYYADYSHGVRLIANMMEIEGELVPVAEVLQNPAIASIISYEGTLKNTRYATEGTWTRKRWHP